MAALVGGVAALQPAATWAQGTMAGRPFVTADGSLYYEHGGAMLGPLAVFGLVFAALVPDEDGNDASSAPSGYEMGWGELDTAPGFALEASQLGGSAGVFLTPHVAAGLRLVAQDNGATDPVPGLWGVGPELTLYPGPAASPLRPFLGVGGLLVRVRAGHATPADRLAGAACQWRAGISWLGAACGFFVQAGYQGRPVDRDRGLALTRAGWGAGMGVILYPSSR